MFDLIFIWKRGDRDKLWCVWCLNQLHQSRDRQRPGPKQNGLAGRSLVARTPLGEEHDALNPTHGDVDGRPRQDLYGLAVAG